MPRLMLLAVAGCAVRVDDLDRDGWSAAQGDCDDLDPEIHPTALDVPLDHLDQNCDGIDVIDEASGLDHQCLLGEDGAVVCGGDDTRGQLDVPTGERFVAIAAGNYHTCGLQVDGTVACWGDDTYGQSSPPEGETFIGIDADQNWSIGEREDGGVCWGLCRVASAVPNP